MDNNGQEVIYKQTFSHNVNLLQQYKNTLKLFVVLVIVAGIALALPSTTEKKVITKGAVTKKTLSKIMQANCEWQAEPNATSYHYSIKDMTDEEVVQEDTVGPKQTKAVFSSRINHTYSCMVEALKTCEE